MGNMSHYDTLIGFLDVSTPGRICLLFIYLLSNCSVPSLRFDKTVEEQRLSPCGSGWIDNIFWVHIMGCKVDEKDEDAQVMLWDL